MRIVLPILTLALLAAPVFAQAPAPTAPDMPAPAETTPPAVAPAPPAPRMQRPANRPMGKFTTANTTGDGKLTFAQAQAANWRPVVRHFAAIDKDHKGYITRREMADYFRALRAQRAAKTPAQ
jgi:hypothetical protein